MVFYCDLFDAVEHAQALHVHAFAVEDAGKIQLLADLYVYVFLDVDQAQAGQHLFVQVAPEVGQVAFFYFRQAFQHFFFIVLSQAVDDVEELDELAVRSALKAVGIELKTPLFRFG